MVKKVSTLFALLFVALLVFNGCSKTPEGEALGKIREAIGLFIQFGTTTDKAISLLEEGAKEIKEPFVEETLALFYLAKHPSPEWEKAIPHLEKSKTKFSQILVAEAMMKKKKWSEASEYLKNKDPLSLFLSAYCHLKLGQLEEAKSELSKASKSEEKIPQPLIFSALGQSQPLACAGLRNSALRWIWDNLEKMGKEMWEKAGYRESLLKIGGKLADYSLVRPEYVASLSLLKIGLNDEEKEKLEKGKEIYLKEAERLEGETMGSLYRLTRLLIFITFLGLVLVGIGMIMIMAGLVKGRGHPLWRRGLISAGIGFGLWVILMLLFYPMPFGGIVQGYVARKFYREQHRLIEDNFAKLSKELQIPKIKE
jgi:tetratricopeptide (TPR) repeat protein